MVTHDDAALYHGDTSIEEGEVPSRDLRRRADRATRLARELANEVQELVAQAEAESVPEQKMVTLRDAAEDIGVNRVTLQRWIDQDQVRGAVKEVGPGGWRWRIPVSEVARLRRLRRSK